MQEIKIVTRKMIYRGKNETKTGIKDLTLDRLDSEYVSASQSPAVIFVDDDFRCRFLYNAKGVAPEHLDYTLQTTFNISILGEVIIQVIQRAGLQLE